MSEMMTIELELPAPEVQVGDQIYVDTSSYDVSPGYWRKVLRILRFEKRCELWFFSEMNLSVRTPDELVLVRRAEENETPL